MNRENNRYIGESGEVLNTMQMSIFVLKEAKRQYEECSGESFEDMNVDEREECVLQQWEHQINSRGWLVYNGETDITPVKPELLCLNQGVELWEVFTPITKEQAIQKFRSDKEVFGLDYEGNESLIQEESDFELFEMFVIEK